MAHRANRTIAGFEVHADPVGLQRRWWTVRIRSHEAGIDLRRLEEAHRELRIAPEEFDEVAAELGRSLDHFRVPETEKAEVLAAFAAHKAEVVEGHLVEAGVEHGA